MSIATRNDTPSATHHGGNVLDAGEETVDLSFHVNCHKCYHMHKHVRLRVHKNPQLFTKFICHNCHHQIAGIGRNETQSSFGSTETQSIEAGYRRPWRPSNLQSCTNADQPDGRLSDVDEAGPTVLSSPSGSMRPRPNLSLHQDSHNDDTGVRSQASVRNDDSPREAPRPTTQSLPKTRSRFIFRLKQGKRHLLTKSKEMRLFGFRFWKWKAPSPPSGVKTGVGPVFPSDIPSDIPVFQPRPRKGDRSVPPQDGDQSPNPPPEFERRPSSVAELLQAKALKNERLRQRRRDATLRRNFNSRPVCHCEANCACMRRGSVGTDAGTDSPSTSRRSTLQHTADVIADAIPNLLSFVLGPRHLSYPGGPLDNTVLDTLAETGTRPNARLSQATTIRDTGEAWLAPDHNHGPKNPDIHTKSRTYAMLLTTFLHLCASIKRVTWVYIVTNRRSRLFILGSILRLIVLLQHLGWSGITFIGTHLSPSCSYRRNFVLRGAFRGWTSFAVHSMPVSHSHLQFPFLVSSPFILWPYTYNATFLLCASWLSYLSWYPLLFFFGFFFWLVL